jgi:hypothetical protein
LPCEKAEIKGEFREFREIREFRDKFCCVIAILPKFPKFFNIILIHHKGGFSLLLLGIVCKHPLLSLTRSGEF